MKENFTGDLYILLHLGGLVGVKSRDPISVHCYPNGYSVLVALGQFDRHFQNLFNVP